MRRLRWLPWVGAGLGATAGLVHVLLLLRIFAGRLFYPLDLEWMESGMLCHALRVMQGKPIYAAPSADFISYLYTPLYPWLLAGLGEIFGLSYLLGRAVSIVCFAASAALAYRVVVRQAPERSTAHLWALLTLGLIASSFPLAGGWYDLVRNDSLHLLLVTAALYLLAYHRASWRWVGVAGVTMGLAFLAKQTASIFVLYSGFALLLFDWRKLLLYVPCVGVVALGTVLIGNALTDGWMWRYIFEMHQAHELYWPRIWPEVELTLLERFPVVAGALGLWLVVFIGQWIVRRQRLTRREQLELFWFGAALTGIATSAIGFSTQWASVNAYIPGLFFPALFCGVAGARLVRRAGGRHRPIISGIVALLVGGALAAQLVLQLYSVRRHVPSRRAYRAAETLIEQMKQIHGPLLVPYHPFYPHLAGQPTHFHQMGTNDVTKAGLAFPEDIFRRIERKRYAGIFLDTPPAGRYQFILRYYKFFHYLGPKESPGMYTGFRVRPRYILVPKLPEPVGPRARRVFGFESGTYDGWQREGDAFGSRPVGGDSADQGLAGPYEGRYLASSAVYGDQAVGTLRSPEFVVDRPLITYLVGGGRSPDIQVRLMVDGREVHRSTGTNNHIMRPRTVDVSRYVGARMRLQLVDHARGTWGHLLFDDLVLHEPRIRR